GFRELAQAVERPTEIAARTGITWQQFKGLVILRYRVVETLLSDESNAKRIVGFAKIGLQREGFPQCRLSILQLVLLIENYAKVLIPVGVGFQSKGFPQCRLGFLQLPLLIEN